MHGERETADEDMSSVDDKRMFESQNCLKSSNYADRNFEEENFKTPQKLGIHVAKLSASLTLRQCWSLRPLHVFQASLTYEHDNGTACIRQENNCLKLPQMCS